MKLVLASYATPNFENARAELNSSAASFGIRETLSYSEADLFQTDYFRANRHILDRVCGAGYWAWKPYFISEALRSLDDGDVLLYADAGSKILSSPEPLVRLCLGRADGLLLFDCRPLRNSQFTKRDCFVRLGCDRPTIWNANKVIATLLFVRKGDSAAAFVAEWLRHSTDSAVITDDPNTCGLADLPDFVQHRWDQAILSVLAANHGVETYRNPTKWGNFLKLPAFRVPGELISSPYGLPPTISTYQDEPQTNSPYGTIFEINRQPNMVGKTPINIERAFPHSGVLARLRRVARRVRHRSRGGEA